MPSSLLELFGVLSDRQNQISNPNLVSPLLNAPFERSDIDTLFRKDIALSLYIVSCVVKNSALIIRKKNIYYLGY